MDIKALPGKERFLYFLNQIKAILNKAEDSDNPALVVYKENMRTPFFMLEALTRLYKKIQNKKKFKKLNKCFKEMEDLLGAIDFYDGFVKEFVTKQNIPELITDYFQKKMDDNLRELNHHLKKEGWLGKDHKRLAKIIKKLDKVNWLEEEDDTIEISHVYNEYIEKISQNYKPGNLKFKDLEADVHELRRDLRWLSIYPQALLGLMQFKEDNEPQDFMKKYFTHEIVNSTYNVMPDGSRLQKHILLDKNYFYSLSWMIDALGKLKDRGLTVMAIEEALGVVYHISHGKKQLVYSICGESQMKLPEILIQSQKIAKTFFEENILKNLLIKHKI
ncbi:MAG: hypothetical protein ABI325_08885 [Ginsengibacter sp.]